MTQPLIDVWAQPVERSMVLKLPGVFDGLAKRSKSAIFLEAAKNEEVHVGIEDHLAMMDGAGVTKVLMNAWYAPEGEVIPNRRIAEFVDRAPERFVGVCSVDIRNPVEACRELEYYVKEKGFKALRVIPWLWNLPPTHAYYYPLFAKCVELGVPFMTQVGHTGPARPSDVGRPIPYIDQVALDFPDLKIICGHLGYPWTEEMISVAWKHDNVYIDTSAYSPRYLPANLIHFMNTYGKDKVMFGTNFPQLSWAQCVKALDRLDLSADAMENYRYKNAARVLGLDNTPDTKNGMASKL